MPGSMRSSTSASGRDGEELLQALLAVGGGGHAEAGPLEVVADEIADLLLVLDDHDEFAHTVPPARM